MLQTEQQWVELFQTEGGVDNTLNDCITLAMFAGDTH